MHHKEPMTEEELSLVDFFVRRELNWGLLCLFLGAFCVAGFVLFSYLGDASEYWILLALGLAISGGGGWSLKKWMRFRQDLRVRLKEVWTTSDFKPTHHEMEGHRSGRLQRYELLIDGERFLVLHNRLEAIGWSSLTANRLTRVEVAPNSRVFLSCSQD